jgi:U4/U6 small nuclear ribonucleoprotein PRP31
MPSENEDSMRFLKEACAKMDEYESSTRLLFTQLLSIFSKRFPELDTIPLSATQYSKIVLAVGPSEQLNQAEAFKSCLPAALALTISVNAAISKGQRLDEEETQRSAKLAQKILNVSNLQKELFEQVEEKVESVSPNLCTLVGPRIAALMIVAAGGLREMLKIPSGNIANLGSKEYLPMLYSNNTMLQSQKRHSLLELCNFVREAEFDFRKIALRLISSKIVLAVRADYLGSSKDGQVGIDLLEEISDKYQKRIEPAPLKAPKPLPTPNVLPKKRRGGRRVRKQKELIKLTEMRKLQNRIAFGQPEEEIIVGDSIKGLGMSTKGKSAVDSRISDYLKKKAPKSTKGSVKLKSGNEFEILL